MTIFPRVDGFHVHVATFADVAREMHPGILLLFARKVTLLAVFVVAVRVVEVLKVGVVEKVSEAEVLSAHLRMMIPAAPEVPLAFAATLPFPPPAPPPPRFAAGAVGPTELVPPFAAPDPPVASVAVEKLPPAPPDP
jgi:hypothetical protein